MAETSGMCVTQDMCFGTKGASQGFVTSPFEKWPAMDRESQEEGRVAAYAERATGCLVRRRRRHGAVIRETQKLLLALL